MGMLEHCYGGPVPNMIGANDFDPGNELSTSNQRDVSYTLTAVHVMSPLSDEPQWKPRVIATYGRYIQAKHDGKSFHGKRGWIAQITRNSVNTRP